MIPLALSLVLAAAPAGTADANRSAIVQAVQQKNGASARVDHVITHGNYALAAVRAADGSVFDGLRYSGSTWRVVCTMRSEPLPTQLKSACGFPQATAIQISADEGTQAAVARGDFGMATIAQVRAYNFSVKGPDRDQERARVQLLHQLSEQMRTGAITRAQAIQRWNQASFSWMLP
jgi:hypothetical protein